MKNSWNLTYPFKFPYTEIKSKTYIRVPVYEIIKP